MQTRKTIVAVAAILLSAVAARASIAIDTVHVGDAGNVADTMAHSGNAAGQALVAYEYNIGKYEVTAGQYTEFLNKVAEIDTYSLYNTEMSRTDYGSGIARSGSSGNYTYSVASDYANRPVNYVSYWDSCRFSNWLSNGQPTGAQGVGTTETGTYTLNGYNGYDGRTIQRNPGSTWAVTSEDEWYKAAYYKGGSTNAGYWDYPTSSNTAPGQDMNDASGNNANYYTAPYAFPIDAGKYTTVVGEFQLSDSPYGTFDQGGNVFEWSEAIPLQDSDYAFRYLRGGSFFVSGSNIEASYRLNDNSTDELIDVGFRVSAVPEPATMAILALGSLGMLRRRQGLGR